MIVDFGASDMKPSKGPKSLRELADKVVLISAVSVETSDADKETYFVTAQTEGNGMAAPEEFRAPKHVAVVCQLAIQKGGADTILRTLVKAPGKRGVNIIKPETAGIESTPETQPLTEAESVDGTA